MLQGPVIFVGLIGTILYLVHFLTRGSRKRNLINKIPGPYAWPIIGNVPLFLVPLDQVWNRLRHLTNKYHSIYRVWMGPDPVVFLAHPDDLQVLLGSSKHIRKSLLYKFVRPWLGTGLLTSGGKKWRQRRRIITPAFHFSVLQQFLEILMKQSDKLVDTLCPNEEAVIDDLVSLFQKYTLNSICETAMGSTSSQNEKDLKEYTTSVQEMGQILTYRAARPWLYFDWSFRWSLKSVDQCRALDTLQRFSTHIIKERRRYHEDTDGHFLKDLSNDEGIYGSSDHNANGKRHLAMLDLLISASQHDGKIKDDGIREEVDTFVFTGSDTTATALSFTLLLFAENKEIQDKARAEVDEVFEELRGEKISIRDIQRMSYLERCIKESLRLFPTVPMISRYITEDLQLKNYLVPAGTTVAALIYDLHRDPNFWPNPTVFDPDRFLPERAQGRHPFAYVPFSAGPRNCIGQKFAMLKLKALLGKILHNFYVESIDSSSEVRLVPDMLIKPATPVRIRLVRRSCEN